MNSKKSRQVRITAIARSRYTLLVFHPHLIIEDAPSDCSSEEMRVFIGLFLWKTRGEGINQRKGAAYEAYEGRTGTDGRSKPLSQAKVLVNWPAKRKSVALRFRGRPCFEKRDRDVCDYTRLFISRCGICGLGPPFDVNERGRERPKLIPAGPTLMHRETVPRCSTEVVALPEPNARHASCPSLSLCFPCPGEAGHHGMKKVGPLQIRQSEVKSVAWDGTVGRSGPRLDRH